MAALHTVVQEGDSILLKCDKVYKPAVVTKGRLVMWCALFGVNSLHPNFLRHVNISKQRVSLCDLIGYKYGTSLKLHSNKLSLVDCPSTKGDYPFVLVTMLADSKSSQ